MNATTIGAVIGRSTVVPIRACVPPWESNPYRPVSLLEMLRVYAHKYVEIGRKLEQMRARLAPNQDIQSLPSVEIDSAEAEYMFETLKEIKQHCDELELTVASDFLHHHLKRYSIEGLREWEDIASVVSNFSIVFDSQLKSSAFLFVSPQRRQYYSEFLTLGSEIELIAESAAGFPDATSEIEAGNCFALERFTACVYHLMRAAEFGLVAVAESIGVPKDKLLSWETMIGGIHGRVNALVSQKAPDCKETEKKYDDLCSWFTTIKNGWRNPASHVPRTYSENTAKGMFAAVRTVFEHLEQQGFKQSTMPSWVIALPDSEVAEK